jgi:hypothetical protein
MKIEIRKGAAYIVILYIIALIIIGLTFSILMKPMKVVYDSSVVNENVQDDVYQDFFTKSRTLFVWLPMLIIIPIMIWIFIKSHEKNAGYQ